MNILYINNYFHVLGGVDRYFFELEQLMRKKGHKTAFFASDSNPGSENRWRKYFVSHIPYSDKRIFSRIRYFLRIFDSYSARGKLRDILRDFKPDIVHVHNMFHQLSPAILSEISKRNIPIIQTVGDYHLCAPNYSLFHNGAICEITKPDKFYRAILHKCVKNSFLVSTIEVLEKYYFELTGKDKKYIDLFVVPSTFMKNKLSEYGVNPYKIKIIPHFTARRNSPENSENNDGYIVYFGRLSEEKGLVILLKAMAELPHIKLKIAGTGPQEANLMDYAKKSGLRNVEFTGFLDGKRLVKLIQNCRFSVLPSVWHEVFGLSVIESFAFGKPVIASKIGAIPEIIRDGINGLLFSPGNWRELAEKIKFLSTDIHKYRKLCSNAQKTALNQYSQENHYRKVLKLYETQI